MRRAQSALAALVLVGGVAAATPAAAEAASAGGSAPAVQKAITDASGSTGTDGTGLSTGMRAALQRDLGLSWPALRARLDTEAVAPIQERRLRTELGAAFGGAWLAGDGSALVVGITDPARAGAVRAAGAQPQVVEHSAADLDATKAALDRHARAAGTAIQSWYVDPATNSVVVQASGRSAADAFIKASGVTGVRVAMQTAARAYRPVYDIRGGDEFNVDIGGGYVAICSVGFAVSGGFVTAGHCGTAGEVTYGSGVSQGTVRASVFPNNDWAWVQTNSSWNSRPLVNNYSGGTVSVAGSQEAAVGSSICRSGRTTGWRCGTIQAKNVTVNYSGQYVYGLTSTSACAGPGDSGGSFISGAQAQGVTSGAGGDCSAGGTTVFQPVNPILNTYKLALITNGNTNRIVGYAGKCIDVPSGNPADGTQLQLWTCNGTGAQDWTFVSDGTVRGMGMCMDVAWGSTADGASVQIANCSGNPAQQFVLSAAGDLVNPQANKCVDVTGANSADGTKLITWTCTGGANQKWSRG